MAQRNLSTEKKNLMGLESRLVVAKEEREGVGWTGRKDLWLPAGVEGVGWIGSLGLMDANYCLWNGLAMRSCCVALGTKSSHL